MSQLETYLRKLPDIHSTGAASTETFYSGCVGWLLNEIGKPVVEATGA